jgi:hypothetical protein
MSRKKLTIDDYRYTPETGEVHNCYGNPVGFHVGEYVYIEIQGKRYPRSHVAWRLMTGKWPEILVDHRDRARDNDCWDNLRLATRTQNNANKTSYSKTGFKGVYQQANGRFNAQCHFNRRKICLGTYDTAEEAARAYDTEATKLWGEFANLNYNY